MNKSLSAENDASTDLDWQVDQVCNRFEAAWKAGPLPAIEPFLQGWSGGDRRALLCELVLLDVHYRQKQGQPCLAGDYQARFPEFEPFWLQQDGELLSTRSFSPALPGSAPNPSETVSGDALPPPAPGTVPALRLAAAPGPTDVLAPPGVPGYQVLGVLGQGGMGIVYKARQIDLERLVALKMIRTRSGLRPSPEALERFRREAQAVARLKHPNIVPIHAWGEHEGQPFFVMEFLEGGSLAKKLERNPCTPRQSAELVAALASALHHAHQRGILHRDLKPANVLLDETGQPHVTDFGLARDLNAGSRTGAGAIVGTPEYMSPEQASGQSETLGPATDVFGLGAILYRMLTGRPPYQGTDSRAVLAQASQTRFTDPRQVNPRIPAGLARICVKALSSDPAQRHGSALALEQDLRRWLVRRKWLALGSVATGVLATIVLLLALFIRPGRSGEGKTITTEPLTGELNVRIWTLGGGKKGAKVQEMNRGAVPVVNGEGVHLEARLNRPAYVYLIWVDSEGFPVPIYPWNRGNTLEIGDLAVPPPELPPAKIVDSPSEVERGWPMEGPSGLETILLLARRDPLPGSVNLAAVLGKLKPAPLVDPREVVLRGFDRDRPVEGADFFRRPGQQAVEIDDALLQMMGRLQPHFEMIRAVRFAHVAEGKP